MAFSVAAECRVYASGPKVQQPCFFAHALDCMILAFLCMRLLVGQDECVGR